MQLTCPCHFEARIQSAILVELTGFEPVTSCLQSRRSPTELQPHCFSVYNSVHPQLPFLTARLDSRHRASLLSSAIIHYGLRMESS